MSVQTQAFTSGDDTIQALLENFSWSGATGQAVTIPYSFGVSAEGGTLFGAAAQSAARTAMQLISNVANITFQESADVVAKLTFSQKDLGSGVLGLTTTFYSGATVSTSEVQLDDQYTGFDVGSDAFLTLLHEIAHALGLKHPGNYSGSEDGPFLPASEDTNDATVMSYISGAYASDATPPRTPMVYDIAALQYLYGANTGYSTGDTAYSYDGTGMALALWDGGGSDILSAISYTGGAATLDLREGLSYLTHIGSTSLWIAEGANIENAAGSPGGDTIHGNALGNTLYGGSGRADPNDSGDTIYGEGGSDALFGNGGNDILYGGWGVADPTDPGDTIYGGGGSDAIYGNGGADSLYGGGDAVDPNDAADTVYGGGAADTIYGNGGGDSLFGGGSSVDPNDVADIIYGGRGNDYILGNGGADTLYGGEDDDTMHAGVGNDTYAFYDANGDDTILLFENPGAAAGDVIQLTSDINDTGITLAALVLSRISYGGDDAVIDLGGGYSITIDGIADGALTADDFTIV